MDFKEQIAKAIIKKVKTRTKIMDFSNKLQKAMLLEDKDIRLAREHDVRWNFKDFLFLFLSSHRLGRF